MGSYDTPGEALSVTVSNNIAYVADKESGLQIIDVSNPQNPFLLGSYDTPGYALSVFVSNNIAYVTDDYAGLLIIDVSNPQNPAFLGSYDTPDWAESVTVSNNIAYVAAWDAGLQIIDVPILRSQLFWALIIHPVLHTLFLFLLILPMWQHGMQVYRL